MAKECNVDMEQELSGDNSFSPGSGRASKHNSPRSPFSQSKKSRYNAKSSSDCQSRNEREEGELESDVSGSPDLTPGRVFSDGLFGQKSHGGQSGSTETVDLRDNEEIVEISLDASGESSKSDNEQDYREVKIMASSDEEMSSENEGDASELEANESDNGTRGASSSENSESSEDESESDQQHKKQKEIVSISEEESSEGGVSDGCESGRNSNQDSATENKTTESERMESGSESDTRETKKSSKDGKSKASQFRKSKQSKEKESSSSRAVPTKQQDSDVETESFADHLQIAAPQQAAILESKKKSSKDKWRDSGSSSRDDRERTKSKAKRREGRDRERERHNLSDERQDKKHRKHRESKYEKSEKTGKEPERLKSSVEKKRTHALMEEDLRKRLLLKRSSRDDDVSKPPKESRDSRDPHRKEERYPRSEKVERRKEGVPVKSEERRNRSKEEREKVEDATSKKSKNTIKDSKDIKDIKDSKDSKDAKGKEYRKDREKPVKGANNDRSKKRPRDKLKPAGNKEMTKSESESSENEEKLDKETKKPSAKRPRSAEQAADVHDKDMTGHKLDSDKESPKGHNYDDISSISSEEMSPPPSPIELKKPTYYPAIMGCRDVKDFQWLNKIEEGTYGVVYRARDNRTDEVVALKRLKMEKEKEGFPITSLREINTLLKAQHPNIVTVREIVVGSNMDKIYIVMDYVEHDLKALMETMTQPFLVGEVKTLMIQLLRGVQHMHDNWILHRDIKASNLLLSHKGILKIGDFGLAREYGSPLKHYTSIVVTLWYRAPELLLGTKEYKTAIDLWSVGCVFAELLTMKPLFPGKSEIDQINRVFKELGTPNDTIWPGPPAYSEYPMVKKTSFANHPYNVLRQKFGASLTDKGFHLLNRLLTYDPSKRITAEDALKHEFFEESPLPIDPAMFPTWPAKSEMGHRTARKQNASPKPPEGGGAASKLANDNPNFGFHMPAATKGFSAKGVGFNLKF